MITDTLTRIFTSRPVKLLLVLFILLAAASQAVPELVDTKPYIDRLSQIVHEETGATLLVKGGSHVQIIPRPSLILKTVEITQQDVPDSPSLSADIAELVIDLPSLVSGNPRVKTIRVAGAAAVAQKQGGVSQWGFLGVPLLKKLAAIKPEHAIQVEIYSSRAAVADLKNGESAGITNMQAAGEFSENARLSGSFDYNDTPVQFSATREGTIGATPITLTLSSRSGSSLSLKGSMDFTAAYPVITAKLEASDDDITDFVPTQTPVDPKAVTTTAADPVPLKLSADFVQKEGLISLANIALETMNSKATGSLQWGTLTPKDTHKLTLDFSTMDIDGVRRLLALYLQPRMAMDEGREPRTLVDKSVNLAIELKATQVKNGSQTWNNTSFSGSVADGVLTINQLSIALPGESTVTLFGLLSITDTQGLRFEGNTEAQGKSLRDLLTVFDESASNLPSLGFGAYKFRSNLFISKELLRLSEADAKFSDLSLKGGLVAYLDKKPRVEAEIGLRNIDFDYFRDSWRANTPHDPGDTVFLRFDKTMNFDWLKKLSASIDFKVNVQGFTFLERKGSAASFRIFAQSGEFGIYNAKFNYDQDITEANLKLDVNGQQPALNLVLNTSQLNTNYFMLKPEAIAPAAPSSVKVEAEAAEGEALPELTMPVATTPEEELRQKIEEEAKAMGAAPVQNVPVIDAEKPAAPVITPKDPAVDAVVPEAATPAVPSDSAAPVELTPLTGNPDNTNTLVTTTPQSLLISEAWAQAAPVVPISVPDESAPALDTSGNTRWPETPIDMSIIEGIGGSFDISVAKLQHKDMVFDSFKMLAKLERNLLTFQTLTFMHWGGSFSINGTIFGGKVPGLSLGFIIASVDVQQMLHHLLGIDTIGGRASVSGTLDTSGVNLLSWVSQATSKMLFAGRGLTIRGFDVASVLSAVSASRTAADVFNNVNMSLVGSAGEYSADGAINLQKGVMSTPGIALKTGRIVGTVTGDFRLIPWDIQLSSVFKFPELSAENVPTLTVQWSGPVEHPTLQTDTQSLEAFVSKRIIGN